MTDIEKLGLIRHIEVHLSTQATAKLVAICAVESRSAADILWEICHRSAMFPDLDSYVSFSDWLNWKIADAEEYLMRYGRFNRFEGDDLLD